VGADNVGSKQFSDIRAVSLKVARDSGVGHRAAGGSGAAAVVHVVAECAH